MLRVGVVAVAAGGGADCVSDELTMGLHNGPMEVTLKTHADHWLAQLFAAKAVANGGVIRRDRRWVRREIGKERFIAEVRQRGFHLIEAGEQWLVICTASPLRRLC